MMQPTSIVPLKEIKYGVWDLIIIHPKPYSIYLSGTVSISQEIIRLVAISSYELGLRHDVKHMKLFHIVGMWEHVTGLNSEFPDSMLPVINCNVSKALVDPHSSRA